MNKSWPSASLDAVLRRVKDGILIRDNETYARLTIRLNGKGIVQRDRVSGGEIGTKRQFVARTGQLVLSKIDARNGAFGVLPQDCDNAIITGNFWAFDPNPEMVMPEYLAFLTTTPLFVEFCVRASEGTTNRRYLQEDEFLAQEILLPPLAEQKRLVGILSQISDKILDVRKTRSIQILRLQEMLTGTFWRIAAEAPRLPLRKVAPLVRRPVIVEPNEAYAELGIRSFGKGTFHKPSLSGAEVGTKRIFMIEPGDLMFSNVFAWEGAIAVARPEDAGRVGSHRFMTCVPNPAIATAEFLCFYFLTEEGLERIGEASPGGAGRNRTLGITALERIPVPVPSIDAQHRFGELLAEVRQLRRLQGEADAVIDALLPSVLSKAFSGEL